MEKVFYEDQCSQRQHLLSQEVDEIYEAEELEQEQERQHLEEELTFTTTTNVR